ncbi:MAG: hypothetical protein HY314_06280 [Acidobacteria bacterium]|nr:hypothetical protein [Acidobacteriota bacterium]
MSERGAWRDWLLFFLQGVAEQARDAITRAKRLQDLQLEWREKLQQARVTGLVLGIADWLFERLFISANDVADRFQVTHQAAMQALRRLEEMGIVHEVSGRQRNRVYRTTDIIRIVE